MSDFDLSKITGKEGPLPTDEDLHGLCADVMKAEITRLTSLTAALGESNITLRNMVKGCEVLLQNARESSEFWKKCYAGETTRAYDRRYREV
mgnify:CR=1 FL=1